MGDVNGVATNDGRLELKSLGHKLRRDLFTVFEKAVHEIREIASQNFFGLGATHKRLERLERLDPAVKGVAKANVVLQLALKISRKIGRHLRHTGRAKAPNLSVNKLRSS